MSIREQVQKLEAETEQLEQQLDQNKEKLTPGTTKALHSLKRRNLVLTKKIRQVPGLESDSESPDTTSDEDGHKRRRKKNAKPQSTEEADSEDQASKEQLLDAEADTRIETLLSSPSIGLAPMTPVALLQLISSPPLLGSLSDQNKMLHEVIRGFSAPEGTSSWATLIQTRFPGLNRHIGLPQLFETANLVDASTTEPLLTIDTVLTAAESQQTTSSFVSAVALFMKAVAFDKGWAKLAKGQKTDYNRDLFIAANSGLFSGMSPTQRHASCKGKQGANAEAYRKFTKNVRDPVTASRTQAANLYKVFGTAAILHPAFTLANLGRKTEKLTRVSHRLREALNRQPHLRHAIEKREDGHRQLLHSIVALMVPEADKDSVYTYIANFFVNHPPFTY
ncbi:hypothetical protein C8F01DRAFT_1080756 [Mycena amicta]|nr:hypothetical protein C8F01DRAFT_1080756 [Mycena amicta]